MEQGLLDSSKYKISLMSLDTRFATQKNAVNSTFRINSPFTMRNVMRIRMASLELPLVEYVFSNYKGNVSFTVKIGNNPNWITVGPIEDGNYTASALVSVLNRLLKDIHSGFLCAIDNTSGRVIIQNASLVFSLNLLSPNPTVADRATHWGLGYYLGFREVSLKSHDIGDGTQEIAAVSVINVQPNPYYLLQLKCPDQVVNLYHPTGEISYVEAFAKIILVGDYYTYQFDDNANLMRKEFTFLSPVSVPFFEFTLLDPWGTPVNMADANWSITLEITEIVNSKTYGALLNTYQRK